MWASATAAIGDGHSQVILALIAVIATSVAALVYVIRTNRTATEAAHEVSQINSAVNHRESGDLRLVEKVDHVVRAVDRLIAIQEEFSSHGWNTLPPDLNNAVQLTGTIRNLQAQDQEVVDKLDTVIEELRAHVAWEMEAKYGKHGNPLHGDA